MKKNPHICAVEIEKCKVQIMSHISLGQRYKIEGYLQINLKKARIAKEIGLPKKTVNQEIKRNSNPQTGIYKAEAFIKKVYFLLVKSLKYCIFAP
ncbi:hypothetical protein C8P65_1174 [Capnocytophaga leadbetteri]|uniref:Helix-turn-helix protein n=1 Tax=Capnocytophaga leadbetteri TaxID=327575 RepID=A0A2T5XS81_9FLAO|nr:hypothetical protein [Capnocytophaga leadbetteri]PTX02583.1 hypothetical protein C8P65_1174 [Capnocytophaga leadbetteri]